MNVFALEFSSWPPPLTEVKQGVAAALGSVMIKTKTSPNGKISRRRQIKVRMDGVPARRWMNLARYWWIRNRGPVPQGMLVAHFNGDALDDDPANYAIFTPGDVLAAHHHDNPRWTARQHKKAAAACGVHNAQRALIHRLRNWLPTRWYPVDPDRRIIFNAPRRERWQIYADAGVQITGPVANGKGYFAAALGWPGVLAASCMAALAAGPMLPWELWRETRSQFTRLRLPAPINIGSLRSVMVHLRRAGLIARANRGRKAVHVLTQRAVQTRVRACPVIAVRGADLDLPEFAGFERRWPDDKPISAEKSLASEAA